MSASIRIDPIFGGRTMPKAYSTDLRERVIASVEAGASRREAAERFEIGASSAVKNGCSVGARMKPVQQSA
jgi:hypothetical protein